jgi:hypothetical protein
MRSTPPSLAFAVIGQARADGKIAPEQESSTVAQLLKHWALRSTLDASTICAEYAAARSAAPAPETAVLQ